MKPLSGDYYVECNALFRRNTNQAERMLEATLDATPPSPGLRMLSVGSGAGLFEVPLLHWFQASGRSVRRFVGIDINRKACETLERRLSVEFGDLFDQVIVNRSFQHFNSTDHFDLVLFNHTFEYLVGDPATWLRKSMDLRRGGGVVLIFSPDRGGINKLYGDFFSPIFADDIHRLLESENIAHSQREIPADCDVSLLDSEDQNTDKVCLLSFLTQVDCRELSEKRRTQFAEYFLSLRSPGSHTIPHPTTLFVL